MQTFFAFLKTKQFFIQLGIILSVIFIILFSTVRWLSSYTDHGNFVLVPEFKGRTISELDSFIEGKGILYNIIDSIYDPKEKAGVVLRQDPEENTAVKHNRTVYLYVTGRVAPQITMPKLIDRSERQARLILRSYGLKVGSVIEKQADCNGCVIAQIVEGKEVAPGATVKKGSVISLIIGKKDAFYHPEETDSTATNEPLIEE